MADIEKLMNWLRHCMPEDKEGVTLNCDTCAYHKHCENCDSIALPMEFIEDVRELLKEREAKPPVHIHEEYPEHDWERKENGEIDDFACSGGDHNGPFCKRCYYTFCIYCKPNGWNDQPCIVDKYKCPGCGKEVVKGTKFCSKCGQEMEWEG